MPEYKYFFEDLATRQLLDELPGLYGLNMTQSLSAPGDWTGTIRMDSRMRKPQDILDATQPGKTLVWVERDKVPIWCGILWVRTYQSDGRSMQFQARTLDAYLGKDYCDVDLTLTDYKTNIVRTMFDRAFNVGANAVGVLQVPAAVGSDGGSTVTKTLVGVDNTYWADVVNEYVRAGVEYRIRYFKDTSGVRQAALDLGRWDLGDAYMIGIHYTSGVARSLFQYPGDIAKYWWSESATDAANVLSGIGKANTTSTPRAVVTNSANLASGYPRLRQRFTFSETENVTLLQQRLLAMRDVLEPPILNPTFACVLNPNTGDSAFGNWGLGDFVDYVLADPYRFPTVRKGCTRITGWALSPPDSQQGPESVGITTVNYNAQIIQEGA